MICHKCYKYGHTKNRCSLPQVCKKCGETGHSIDNCKNNYYKCPNCDGDHIAGSREWEAEKKERKIKEVQTKEKVGRRRAIQILSGEDETPTSKSTKFPTHFSCQMNPEQKKKFSPWMIEKCFTQVLWTKPRSIRSKSDSEFIIEINTEGQSRNILSIEKLNNVDVRITECTNINQSKGLVYIYDYNVPDSDFKEYSTDLKKAFNLVHVQKAFWIKTKNNTATPLILTFREKEPPKFLNILGEQTKTKVYEYFDRPMMCQDCLEYGHTAKRCRESTFTCAQCNDTGHSIRSCEISDAICHHCEDSHRTFSKNCPRYKEEIEIIKIQTRERVSKIEAKQRLLKENPNKMNYAKAVKQKSHTSEIPSTTANSDALDNDLNDTSETNPTLRKEAQEIFKNTELVESDSELR